MHHNEAWEELLVSLENSILIVTNSQCMDRLVMKLDAHVRLHKAQRMSSWEFNNVRFSRQTTREFSCSFPFGFSKFCRNIFENFTSERKIALWSTWKPGRELIPKSNEEAQERTVPSTQNLNKSPNKEHPKVHPRYSFFILLFRLFLFLFFMFIFNINNISF